MPNATIQSVLNDMHAILSNAVGPDNRRAYLRAKNIHGNTNWSFSLTPHDIIRDRIPSNVIGCTGRAKLFCHLAAERGLTCDVVAMAAIPDWRREYNAARGITPDNSRLVINGHQIIAVNTPDGPRMFDPVRHRLTFLPQAPRIGGIVDIGMPDEYIIRAIVPGDEFINLSSYWDIDMLYRLGRPDTSD